MNHEIPIVTDDRGSALAAAWHSYFAVPFSEDGFIELYSLVFSGHSNEVEALRAENERLRTALRPFAAVGHDKLAHGNYGNYINDRMPLQWFIDAAHILEPTP